MADLHASFEIALAELAERKADLVAGSDEIEVPSDSEAVGIKLTDMLGEEALVVLPVTRYA